MQIVTDKVYLDTIKRVKTLIKIENNPKEYKKKVLINLMPTFAFKQLVIFIRLGEYLKRNGFFVDYFICDGIFNHCDMVKMNDEIDRDIICERCKKATKKLNIPFVEYNFSKKQKYDKTFLKNSLIRFSGEDIKFKQYKKKTKQNLKIASKLKYDYDFLISLNHFENYSIAPFINSFKNRLFLGLNEDKIFLFGSQKDIIFNQKLNWNSFLQNKIENYFKNRIKFNNNFTIDTDKKIISFFPNILEDAFEDENNIIFNSMLEWLEESVKFALKNNFFVIIKAHPAEVTWKPTKSVLDYIEDNENILKIPPNSEIKAYDIIKNSDFVSVYNGTIFYESLIMDKKVVLGGKIGDIYHKSKKKYFKQFLNYKKYDYKKAREYGYKILFTKAFKLEMIDTNLPYPHINYKKDEIVFKAIEDIILEKYDVNKYVDKFVAQY